MDLNTMTAKGREHHADHYNRYFKIHGRLTCWCKGQWYGTSSWTGCWKRRISQVWWISRVKVRANGRNIAMQQLPTLLGVTCCVRLKLVKLLSQQLPTFLLFRDHWHVAQQCCIRFQKSYNIVGATHVHYIWSLWKCISARHSTRRARVWFLFELRLIENYQSKIIIIMAE